MGRKATTKATNKRVVEGMTVLTLDGVTIEDIKEGKTSSEWRGRDAATGKQARFWASHYRRESNGIYVL